MKTSNLAPSLMPFQAAENQALPTQGRRDFGDPMEIMLSKGLYATVDAEDYNRIVNHKWCANKIGRTHYAKRAYQIDGKQKTEYMHRVIMGNPPGMEIDHINGNGLDNRKENLRVCTHKQNLSNLKPREHASSKHPGVSMNRLTGKYEAYVNMGGKKKHLGLFQNEHDAINAQSRFFNVA